MKMIIAIIKPFKLDDLREALSEIGVQGVTYPYVKAIGEHRMTCNHLTATILEINL